MQTTVQRLYGSIVFAIFPHFGEYGERVNTSDCESDSAGSNPVTHLIYEYSSMVEYWSPKPMMWVQILLLMFCHNKDIKTRRTIWIRT